MRACRRLSLPSLRGKTSTRRRRRLAWVFALIFGAGVGGVSVSPAAAREVPFGSQQVSSTAGDFVRAVFAADVDGDGDLDLLWASIADDQIAWQENLAGDGSSWAPPSTIATTADSPRAVFAADVDGDGDVDALSASVSDDQVAWYENTAGDGSAWTTRTITTAADGARSVFAADVDGDGDLDVLSASTYDDTVAWYENTAGNGTAWTPRTIYTSATGARAVFAADVDGDGDVDALATATADDLTHWFENVNGDGSLWTERTIGSNADGPVSVFAAGIDGDGDLDAVAGSYYDDAVTWYENLGGGTVWASASISTTADGVQAVLAADMDGDGDTDALSASFADDRVAWYENVGGGLWTTRTITSSADGALAVFAADVDGDGDLDALSASGYDDKVAWYENETIHRGAVFPQRMTISTLGDGPYSVSAADVDGDGDLDALSASLLDDRIAWHENTAGDGSAWTTRTISTAADIAVSVFAVDVDGDGDVDALSASYGDDKIAWYENTAGDGTAWTPGTISTTASAAQAVSAADVDGDGDVDVLSASSVDGRVAWYENVGGDGSLWQTRTIATTTDGAFAVFAADIDGDGDADVLSGSSYYDEEIAWHENTAGDGTAWTTHSIATTTDILLSVFPADVDGDGDLDALCSFGSNEVAWYENTAGDGSTWTRRSIATSPARSLFAADVDDDGDMDALSVSLGSSRMDWYENTAGDGSAWSARNITTTAGGARSVFAADVDQDGDLDAVTALSSADRVAWYENRGGQFALPTVSLAQGVVANSQEQVLFQIDLEHRGRAGDSDVELATIELRFEDGASLPLSSAQANALIEKLELFVDNGSGSFEPGTDTLVEQLSTLTLTNGATSIALVSGNPDAQAAFGATQRYFVVATMTGDADLQTPDSFEAFHLTEASSTGRDANASTVPLTLEYAADASTGTVDTDISSATCTAPFTLDLEGFTVSTTVTCEAGTVLSAGNGLNVTATGNLTLRAGQEVQLESDFSVGTGGTLAVENDPSLEPP